jgi:hypothetical protein
MDNSTDSISTGSSIFSSRFTSEAIPSTSNSPVHWQSAFWGIVLIAFNTMIQDSGDICGRPAQYRFMTRSSPFVCLADSITILIHFATLCFHSSPLNALRLVAVSRGQHRTPEDETSTKVSTILVLWIVRVLALIQAIKVVGLQGLPWTKAFGAMFLSSYMLVEAMNLVSLPDETTSMRDRSKAQTIRKCLAEPLFQVAAWSQLVLWTYSLHSPFPDFTSLGSPSFIKFLAPIPSIILVASASSMVMFTVYFILGVIDISILATPSTSLVLLVLILYSILRDSPKLHSSLGRLATMLGTTSDGITGVICTALGISAVALQVYYFGVWHFVLLIEDAQLFFEGNWDFRVQMGGAFLTLGGITLVLYVLLLVLSRLGIAEYLPSHFMNSTVWLYSRFLFFNFSVPLVYYSYIYTGEGIVKPAWTENLG